MDQNLTEPCWHFTKTWRIQRSVLLWKHYKICIWQNWAMHSRRRSTHTWTHQFINEAHDCSAIKLLIACMISTQTNYTSRSQCAWSQLCHLSMRLNATSAGYLRLSPGKWKLIYHSKAIFITWFTKCRCQLQDAACASSVPAMPSHVKDQVRSWAELISNDLYFR